MVSAVDLPVVKVWRAPKANGTDRWDERATIENYVSLSFSREYLGAGSLELSMPADDQTSRILTNGALTLDWRGQRWTYLIRKRAEKTDETTGVMHVEVSGISALSALGWSTAWPSPSADEDHQVKSKLYSGPAETVIRQMVADNIRDRLDYPLRCPTSQGRGRDVKARVRFRNVLEKCIGKARLANLTLDVGLVSDGTRGDMTLLIGEPDDKTKRVHLSPQAGTLSSWQQVDAAPEVTRAIVLGQGQGADRKIITVDADDNTLYRWGVREQVVDRRDTDDDDELTEAGLEKLDGAAQTRALSMTAVETEGLKAFRDYDVGDKVTAQVVAGDPVVEVVSQIQVDVSAQDGVKVTPTVGAANDDPYLTLSQIIRALRQQVRDLETRL